MDRLLSTYLNDHLAASLAALELVRRAASSNAGTATGTDLDELATEIASDREALLSIMDQLGAGKDRVKVSAAWAAEKLGRLKLNGRLFSYSPLSRVEEIELLVLGVEGKLLLWETLQHLPEAARLDPPLDELIGRARAQRRRLRRLRAGAVRRAFT